MLRFPGFPFADTLYSLAIHCDESQYTKVASAFLKWLKKELSHLKPIWVLVGLDPRRFWARSSVGRLLHARLKSGLMLQKALAHIITTLQERSVMQRKRFNKPMSAFKIGWQAAKESKSISPISPHGGT